MMIPTLFEAVLLAAAVLCSLVSGFLLAFAVVVMPGIGRLDDRSFLGAFQVIDRVIQNNHPLFVFIWIGSLMSAIAAAVLGLSVLTGSERLLLVAAALVYLLGVQVPTATINIPLNNRLQRLDVTTMTDTTRREARAAFESRWNRWNAFRTVCASVASFLLLLLLLMT